jgi:DNA-binding NtrC family response regulator
LIASDPDSGRPVRELLAAAGYQVSVESSATRSPDSRPPDAVLARLDWTEADNAERVSALRQRAGSVPLLLLAPAARVELAVRALRHGADDYLIDPPDRREVEARLEGILERHDLDSQLLYFRNELSKQSAFKSLEARSAAMRAVVERILRVAPLRSTVLIQGESGVGKELVARSIHFNSPRHGGPFIALNCAAMAPSLIESELFGHEKGSFTGAHSRARGKFEIAHRGTLFLDEIAEMEPGTQAKLLRVLEEKEFMRVGGDRSVRVDVRVIAATNADLEARVADGRFRADLYYRLKVLTIRVPPLRERREDIPPLVEAFLAQLARGNAVRPKAIAPEALVALQSHQWPGNVRELKNILESLLVATPGDTIRPEDLPPSVGQSRPAPLSTPLAAGTTLAEMERELIRRTLEHTGGNRTHGAALLGIGVRTLQRKLRVYDLSIPSRRRRRRRRVAAGGA